MDSLLYDLPALTIRRISVSEMDNNVYLLTAKASGEQVLIDAADDLPAIQQLLQDAAADTSAAPRLVLIATTHQHWDHVRALKELVAATGAPTAAGKDDADALPVAVDRHLQHGDTVAVDGFELTAVHLRGHTPGSIALALDGPATGGVTQLFTGDCLFPGGVGKTWQPGDFTQLIEDVSTRVFDVYDDSTVIYPGHGDDTALGAERPHLSEWRERGW